jgi:GNAT superfamily N-acetyltransferase
MLKTEFETVGTETIEKATLEDLMQIVSINQQFHDKDSAYNLGGRWRENSWTSRETENGNFFVFKSDGNIKGAICLIQEGKILTIETIAVHKSEQGKGIGRKMIDFAINHAKTNGSTQIKVGSFIFLGVQDFYLKCGFEFDKPATAGFGEDEYYRFIKKL